MTFVRSAPTMARRVAAVTDAERQQLDRLVAADPIANAVVAARLASFRHVDSPGFGGAILGARCGEELSGAAFDGGNLLPIGGDEDDWEALAEAVARRPRRCTSIVGRQAAVAHLWSVLETRWGPARAIRDDQPLLVLGRGDRSEVAPDPRVQAMRLADLERYLPAAAAMFTEELGVSPFAGPAAAAYRRRIESLLANGRAFGIVDADGRMAFKADLGAVTRQTCQVQGVWTRPDLRGHGLATAALAAVIDHALRLAPTASLYVNDFNWPARRVYARLGMRQAGSLATVLL